MNNLIAELTKINTNNTGLTMAVEIANFMQATMDKSDSEIEKFILNLYINKDIAKIKACHDKALAWNKHLANKYSK